jgi:hypothetical protein
MQLPKRLARRLMDLQFLPYIVVTNPHIKTVYDAYYHAFNTLIALKPVETAEENEEFTALLMRLVDEHGAQNIVPCCYRFAWCEAVSLFEYHGAQNIVSFRYLVAMLHEIKQCSCWTRMLVSLHELNQM